MYLPFAQNKGPPAMGLKPLALQDWLEIDPAFLSQLAQKTALLTDRYHEVFGALAHTQPAQQEALELLAVHLLQFFPAVYCSLKGESAGLYNLKTQQTWRFADFAAAPLDLAGRLVQEDLCLLLPAVAGYRLAAASVCFPLRWRLAEKLGQPVGQIHQRVPDYAQRLERPVDNMFSRLRADFPSLRFNWSLVDSPELYLSQDKQITGFDPAITADNAGQRLWLRVERQTLRRLTVSQGILFTIRTHIYPLAQVTQSAETAVQLSRAVQSLSPDMQIYKNLLPFRAALLAYLDRCVTVQSRADVSV